MLVYNLWIRSNTKRHPFQPASATAGYSLFLLVFLAMIICPGCQDGQKELVLASGGSCDYQVILPEHHNETLAQAAGMIRDAFGANGFNVPVLRENEKDDAKPGIYLGDTRIARSGGIDPSGFESRSYLTRVAGRDLIISGPDEEPPIGVFKGVCDFLREYAGVRFLYPGETGTEYLDMPVISVPADLDFAVTPMLQFNYSGDMYPGEWMYNIANNHFPAAFRLGGRVHSWGPAIPYDEYHKTHPEYFALLGGKRWAGDGKSQYCISNPDVMDLIIRDMVRLADEGYDIVYLGQPDSFKPCECNKCYEFHGTGDDWNEKVWLFNRAIAERFEKLRPDTKILMLAYQANNNPPKSFKKFPDNAIIELHHGHDIALNEWSESGVEIPGGVFLVPRLFGSHYVVNYLPKRTPAWLEERVRKFYSVNMDVVGLRPMGAIDCYGLEGPAYYVFGRMFDDPLNNRAEDLVEEFYSAAFGEAVAPMRRFYNILHKNIKFCSEWFFPRSPGRFFIGLDRKPSVTKIDDQLDWVRVSIVMLETGFHRSIPAKLPEMGYSLNYTPELVLQMEKELERAETLAATDRVKKRLELVHLEFTYMKNAMRIIYLYNAWKIDPDPPALSRLLEGLDTWDAMLDSYYDENGSMTSVPGWPEIRPFRGIRRPALGLVTARWWIKKIKKTIPLPGIQEKCV